MKNKKGSTIVWAITLIMVLVVIVGASLSFAYISYNKAIQYKSKTQAELTAQSVALVNQITQSTSSETFEGNDQVIADNTKKLIPTNDGDVKRIESDEITLTNQKMGKVNYVTITKNQNNKLTIQVKATYANQISTVNAIMKKESDGEQWNIYKYEGASS